MAFAQLWGKKPLPPGEREKDKSLGEQTYFYSASAGHVLSADGSGYVVPSLEAAVVEKKDYVPKSAAVERVHSLAEESAAQRARYTAKIAEVTGFYQSALDQSKAFYEDKLRVLKENALRHVEVQKKMRENVEEELNGKLQEARNELENLRDTLAETKTRLSDEIKALKKRLAEHDAEIQRLVAEAQEKEREASARAVLFEVVQAMQDEVVERERRRERAQAELLQANITQSFHDQLRDVHDAHARERDELDARNECSSVLSLVVQRIEVAQLAEDGQRLSLLQETIETLQDCVREKEQEIEDRQRELEQLRTDFDASQEKNAFLCSEIDRLSSEYAEERERAAKQGEDAQHRLQEDFEERLRLLQSERDALEIKTCLDDIVNRIASKREAELNLSLQALNANEREILQKQEQEAAENERKAAEERRKFDEKIKRLKNKFQSVLVQLRDQNERLQVEIELEKIIVLVEKGEREREVQGKLTEEQARLAEKEREWKIARENEKRLEQEREEARERELKMREEQLINELTEKTKVIEQERERQSQLLSERDKEKQQEASLSAEQAAEAEKERERERIALLAEIERLKETLGSAQVELSQQKQVIEEKEKEFEREREARLERERELEKERERERELQREREKEREQEFERERERLQSSIQQTTAQQQAGKGDKQDTSEAHPPRESVPNNVEKEKETAKEKEKQADTAPLQSARRKSSVSVENSEPLQALLVRLKTIKEALARNTDSLAVNEGERSSCEEEKEKMKLEIKEWTRAFQEANGRDPENADKQQIRDKYQRYKNSTSKSKELEAQKNSLTQEKADLERELQEVQTAYKTKTQELRAAHHDNERDNTSPRLNLHRKDSAGKEREKPRDKSPERAIDVRANTDSLVVEKARVATSDAEVQTVGLSPPRSPREPVRDQMKRKESKLKEEGKADVKESDESQKREQDLQLEREKEREEALEREKEFEQQLERLEDELFAVKEEREKQRAELQKIQTERDDLQTQLDILVREKRTDVLKRMEEDLQRLRESENSLTEKLTTLSTEKTKLESRVSELKERAEAAENELKQRDARELQTLPQNDEKFQLKGQISKQREQIIVKSKAATAGWDAAANADERLEIEVQKAYNRGVKEEAERQKNDLSAIHRALEEKETRITGLLLQITEMEKKVREKDEQKTAMEQQVEAMKLEVADAIAGIQMMASAAVGMAPRDGEGGESAFVDSNGDATVPPSVAELERALEQLDTAQDEIVSLSERCDRLESELEVARKKNRVFERLATLTGLTSGEAMQVSSDRAPASMSKKNVEYDVNEAINIAKRAVAKGTNLWKSNKKDECFDTYLECCQSVASRLLTDSLLKPLRTAADNGRTQGAINKPRGAQFLRNAIDKFLADAAQPNLKRAEEEAASSLRNEKQAAIEEKNSNNNAQVQDLLTQLESIDNSFLEQGYTLERNPGNSSAAGTAEASPRPQDEKSSSLLQRARAAEEQVKSLKKQLAAVIAATVAAPAAVPAPAAAAGGPAARPTTAAAKGKAAAPAGPAAAGGADPAEVRRLNRKIKELEDKLKQAQQQQQSGGGASSAELKAAQAAEKALQKKLKDLETSSKRELKTMEVRANKAEMALSKIQSTYDSVKSERDTLRGENDKLIKLTSDLEHLKVKAEQCETLTKVIADKDQELKVLAEQFQKESKLRKQYKNELEDLKGAIRVYARCRPMARYEIERGCKQAIEIKDETSVRITSDRGTKEFEFDAVFSPTSTQEQVFDDTKRLVESCLDGFNVCVFAYGQTGSGKTFTMTGSPQMEGLTPRTCREIFRLIAERVHCTCKVTTYFVELYNDNLVDLYFALDQKGVKGAPDPPKLEIKMDAKKMVFIRNCIIKEANSADELMTLFESGNSERHTGSTKMNAESSRSHSIFAIMVESYDTTSKRTITGKLSLVDLAGSERASKTEANAERLREAQSINKSLSALGNVIAALSEGGNKHIPYRNNKLTQLMQDSLGGNAKTLMFVNFSPADYNAEETLTSLVYAERVKKIVNNASKQAESAEVARLKQIIKLLKAGKAVGDIEAPEEVEAAAEEPPPVEEDDGNTNYDGY